MTVPQHTTGYRIGLSPTGDRFIQCMNCKLKSYNPNDIKEKYCGKCHTFHDLVHIDPARIEKFTFGWGKDLFSHEDAHEYLEIVELYCIKATMREDAEGYLYDIEYIDLLTLVLLGFEATYFLQRKGRQL